MNIFERPEWEIPLLQSLSSKFKKLHDDWDNGTSDIAKRKYFNKPSKNNGWSYLPWTLMWKEALSEIAQEYGFKFRPNSHEGEFNKRDFIWYESNPGIPFMVCEAQWIMKKGIEGIREDFVKLLDSNSPYAILIFDSNETANAFDDFKTKLRTILNGIELPSNRRFLFVYATSTEAVKNASEKVIYAQAHVGNEIINLNFETQSV